MSVEEVPFCSQETTDKFENIFETLCTLKQSMSSLQTQIKFLEKSIVKEVKFFEKHKKKKINRKPSGFANPTTISNELKEFLNHDSNTIARTDVTKLIIKYIKDHSLQYQEDRRIIIPDEPLKKLLYINEDSPKLTYFNIQRFLNPHFIKPKV
ncbi:MAG: hypothetical protein CMF80_08250 [Candidatus Marinimicrobia bacterium]|nr:hypothetical protein [Candidatus Neomarinimicrobiota bacterium]|tara:strand:- start:30 stop:488 length:459 start_codon:yes stop_codon:yes gene_type:complete